MTAALRLLAISLLALAAAALPGRAAETTVKVGFCAHTVTSSAAPYAIATKMGWYAEAGIKVELVAVPGSTDCIKLVATGDLPYAVPSVEALPTARLQGVRAKIFYTAYQGNIYGVAVPAASPIKSIKDLRDKKIGVASMASGAVPVVRALLQRAGMDPDKDAHIMVVGEAAQAAMLARGNQVDALALYDTQFALIESAGVPLRFLNTGPLAKFPSNGFLALESTLEKERAQSVAVARGYAMGTVFALANPEAAVRIFYAVYPQYLPTGKTPDDAVHDEMRTLLARAEHWKLASGGVTHWGESSVKEFDAYEDFLLKYGVIKEKVPATDLVTNALLPEIDKFDAAKITAEAKAYR